MHKPRENGDRRIWAVVVLLAGAVFTFDVLIPLGVAGAVPYVAVVLVSLWAPRPRQTILLAAFASTALTILGIYFSPPDGVPWMVALNRLLAIAAVWVTAILALWHKTSKQAVERARDELEGRVQQRTAELRHLNEKLREETAQREQTQQQFHDVVESAPDAIVLIDTEGTLLIVNAQTEALFGFSRDEMLRQPVEMLLPERFREKHVLQRQRFSEQPAVRPMGAGLELFGRKKNGDEFPIEISLSTVTSARGVLYAAMIRDVTERKRTEAALRAREQQQAVVATLGQIALAGVELDDLMAMLVERVAAALQVDYCKIMQLLPGEEKLLLKAGVGWQDGLVGRATESTGRDSQAGYTLHSSEPVIVDDLREESRFLGPPLLRDHGVVSGLSVIIPGPNGPYGVLGVHSKQRRAFSDDAVNFLRAIANLLADAVVRRGAEDRMRFQAQLLDSVREAVVATDLDGRIIYWGNGSERLYGYRAEEVLGEPVASLVDPAGLDESRRRMRSVLENGFWSGQHDLRRKDGTHFWGDTAISLVVDENGTACGFIGINRDISERKQAEETLRQLETELAHLSRVSSMGEMAVGIAHEVNQPLYAISNCALACAKTLEAASDDSVEKAMTCIREISKQASSAGEIIRGVTRFVQKNPLRHTSVDVNDAVREAVKLASFEAQRHRSRIETKLTESLPFVSADRIQIQQVLLNLVRNACEAMAESDAADCVVSIATALVEGMVKITVTDNGTGIPPEEHERLFETFYSTKPHGTGMGLAISRTIVKAHGGRLWASQDAGGGASFHFTLPTMAGAD